MARSNHNNLPGFSDGGCRNRTVLGSGCSGCRDTMQGRNRGYGGGGACNLLRSESSVQAVRQANSASAMRCQSSASSRSGMPTGWLKRTTILPLRMLVDSTLTPPSWRSAQGPVCRAAPCLRSRRHRFSSTRVCSSCAAPAAVARHRPWAGPGTGVISCVVAQAAAHHDAAHRRIGTSCRRGAGGKAHVQPLASGGMLSFGSAQ